jgi:phenylpyruvate tautomerase PptA (4-oxalocrotonate tautomerase family)
MPNMIIKVPEGAFDAAGREKLGQGVHAAAKAVEGWGDDPRQEALTWVLVEEVSSGNLFVGGADHSARYIPVIVFFYPPAGAAKSADDPRMVLTSIMIWDVPTGPGAPTARSGACPTSPGRPATSTCSTSSQPQCEPTVQGLRKRDRPQRQDMCIGVEDFRIDLTPGTFDPVPQIEGIRLVALAPIPPLFGCHRRGAEPRLFAGPSDFVPPVVGAACGNNSSDDRRDIFWAGLAERFRAPDRRRDRGRVCYSGRRHGRNVDQSLVDPSGLCGSRCVGFRAPSRQPPC